MLNILNIEDEDLGRIRRGMNFLSLLLLVIWWTGASLDLSKGPLSTPSGVIGNATLWWFTAALLAYYAIRHFFVTRWYLPTSISEMKTEGSTVGALLSELQSSYREMKTAIQDRAKLSLPDMSEIDNIQAQMKDQQEQLKILAQRAFSEMHEIEQALHSDMLDPAFRGPSALEHGRIFSAEEKAVFFNAAQEIYTRAYELEWPNGEVLSEKVQELSQIIAIYRHYIETPELDAAAERIRLVGPKVTDLLTGRILDLRIFSLWAPRLFAAVILFGTAVLPPP